MLGKNKASGNWYPITSAISIMDGSKVFTVMNDRSMGGSAIEDGTV